MTTTTKRQTAPLRSSSSTIRDLMSMGVGLFQIATDAGVPWATLQRFMQHEQSLSLREFDLLCCARTAAGGTEAERMISVPEIGGAMERRRPAGERLAGPEDPKRLRIPLSPLHRSGRPGIRHP
jgi:hypothetical protein